MPPWESDPKLWENYIPKSVIQNRTSLNANPLERKKQAALALGTLKSEIDAELKRHEDELNATLLQLLDKLGQAHTRKEKIELIEGFFPGKTSKDISDLLKKGRDLLRVSNKGLSGLGDLIAYYEQLGALKKEEI